MEAPALGLSWKTALKEFTDESRCSWARESPLGTLP